MRATKEQEHHDSLVKAIKALTGTVDHRLKELLEKMGGGGNGEEGGWEIPEVATSAPDEEVLIRYTVGKGKFDANRRYNYLKMNMYHMDGTPDGTHDGVWKPELDPPDM